MAKTKKYSVSISPAFETPTSIISLIMSGESHPFEAASFEEIASKRDAFIKTYGYTCRASIYLERGQRKSPGFDKWQRTQPRIYNPGNTHPELESEAARYA